MNISDYKPSELFLNPGFGFGQGQTRVSGSGCWIFTKENVEADDRMEEILHRKCIYGWYAVANRNTRDRRLYIR